MPRLLNFPWLRRLLGRGVNTDTAPELMPDGYAREAVNVRPRSIGGDSGSMSAIGGEDVASFEQQQQNNNYSCIGSASCNGHFVEFYIGPTKIVKIDGVVVAESDNIPYVADRPLQIAVVNDVRRGVLYVADHNSDPLYWDIQDLLDNVGNQLYFADYNTDTNSVLLTTNPEFPVHVGNVEVSPGLPVGEYQYALRYVSPLGDRSAIGPWTPLITVPLWQDRKLTWQQQTMPGLSTVGGPVSPDTLTGYGIKLQFRIDNQQGYSAIEIIRRKLIDGTGKSITEVVDRYDIAPGQVSVETFIDPADAVAEPEVVPDDESGQQLFTFTKPKAVEYQDRRIVYGNFETESRDSGITFTEVNGQKMVPITQGVYTQPDDDPNSIYNDGYSDPVNNTYMKTYVRGEKYGFGVMVWDKFSNRYYVTELADEYQFPNRRDPKLGDSLNGSDNPIWAANTNCNGSDPSIPLVTSTFDAFTQGNKTKYPLPPSGTGYNFINMAVSQGAAAPWGPTDPIQSGSVALNDQTRVDMSPVVSSNNGNKDSVDLRPMTQAVWAPQHQAIGGMIYGVENIPRGAKVMSIMRTAPANRVIAQGIATYRLFGSSQYTAPDLVAAPDMVKSLDSVWVDFPDLRSGVVDQATQDDILANPQNYALQFVSPLGVTSDPYGWQGQDVGGSNYTGRACDMITYAGIQYDEGQVNNGEPLSTGMGGPGMAYQASGGSPAQFSNYVGYGAWRGSPPPSGVGPFHNTQSQGNHIFSISNISIETSGRSSRFLVTLSESLYSSSSLAYSETFDSPATRLFHEPFYVVNIIRRDARVADLTIDQYINTGYHVKIESCIGVSTGGSDTFRLLNERWDDVLSADPTQYRYVWVQQGSAQPRAWFQINGNQLAPFVQAILNTIAQDGFWVSPEGVQCYGICVANLSTASSSSLRNIGCTVSFGAFGTIPLPVPPANSRILVKYNKNAPIKFFGGDATIAQCLSCIVDGYADCDQSGSINGVGDVLWVSPKFPYIGYRKNPGYKLPITSSSMAGDFATRMWGLRQWCILWDSEQRSAIRYTASTAIPGGPYSWPKVGYVIKPFGYDSNDPANGMYAYPTINVGGADVSLTQDYARGGILFSDSFNPDYSRQPEVDGFGIPFDDQGGIAERTQFPTGLIASLEVDPLLTDAPGVRTFISQNLKVLSEESGEIKCIGSAVGSGGRNIYAWMDKAVSRVLTSKNILTGASGEQISTIVVSNFWGDEMVLSRQIGSPDEMWRLWIKANAPTGQGYADSFFWPDRNSWYRLTGDTIIDIGRDKFLAESLDALRSFPVGFTTNTVRSSAVYDRKHNEALFSLYIPQPADAGGNLSRPVRGVYVYSPQTGEWNGRYTYSFDCYAMHDGSLYGSRNKQAWLLDTGSTISGTTRESSITVPIVGDMGMYKEFIRWRISGRKDMSKPDRIEILDANFDVIVRKDATINNSPYWTKYYDGWEGFADRVLASFDAARPLPQDQYFYLRLIWNTEGEKVASAMSAQVKNIK